jgi:transcriptional regulator with XRE-family HTH domain
MKIYDFDGKKNICGERVRAARKKLGLTQDDLAARLQVLGVEIERNSISRIESGDRFVADYELLTLSNILKVSPSYLLGIE